MPRYRENFYNVPAEMNEEEDLVGAGEGKPAEMNEDGDLPEGKLAEGAGEGEPGEPGEPGQPGPNTVLENPRLNPSPSPAEEFGNINMNTFPVDLVLKSIFFGAIFYLLSLPEVYKMTKKCCKSVDGVLLHSVVFAILYFILVQFIN